MTEIKNGDTVVVDLDTPYSSWHKAEGVLVEKSPSGTSGKVRITKLSLNYPSSDAYGAKKVGDETFLVNLTKAPGFRVGTKALCTGKITGFEGQTVTVTEAIMNGVFDYRVARVSDGQLCPVHHCELQRIEEPVKPKIGFKIGDRVTVKGYETRTPFVFEGRTGTVSNTYGGNVHVKVDFTDGKKFDSGTFTLKYVVPAKPEPEAKFKVGDRVTVKGWGTPGASVWEGRTGKVYLVAKGAVCLNFEDGKSPKSGGWDSEYLVPAEEPKPVWKKGDIVKPKPGSFEYISLKGKTIIVEEILESVYYPVGVRAVGEPKGLIRYYSHNELEAGEKLAQWEIELLDDVAAEVVEDRAICDPPKFAKGGYVAFTKPEAVDGPAHYGGKENPYEAIKVAEAWGFNKEAYLFNALKYLARAGKKGDKVEDLKKLVFYVEREIALEEASGN